MMSAFGDLGDNAGRVAKGMAMDAAHLESAAKGQQIGWKTKANDQNQNRLRDAASRYSSAADYEAQMAAWEAKNDFAAHASAMGGIAGMNSGNLAPHDKPQQMDQLATAGMADGWTADGWSVAGGGKATQDANNNASSAAWYSEDGGPLERSISAMQQNGDAQYGRKGLENYWENSGGHYTMTGAIAEGLHQARQGGNYYSDKDQIKAGTVINNGIDRAKEIGGQAKAIADDTMSKVGELGNRFLDQADGEPGK
jgi:hypothetical protein